MSSILSTKKILGKYYTSLDLARAITDWTIRHSLSTVLDPSFGKAVFLKAASRTFGDLGTSLPARNLYGVDVDNSAKNHLGTLLQQGARETSFLIDDFLSLKSKDLLQERFDVVIGNPPFVRSSQIPNDLKETAKQSMVVDGFKICEMSGYWAYFLLHSLTFLKTGGRLAMILPSAFLSAQYSTRIRRLVSNHFQKTSVLVLNDKWFPDAEESIVILLAENYCQADKHRLVSTGLMNSERERILASRLNGSQISSLKETCRHNWSFLLDKLPSEVSVLLRPPIKNNEYLMQLGDFAAVKIGVVTGANDFFVLSPSKAQELRIPEENLMTVVNTSRSLKGLNYVKEGGEAAKYLLVTSIDETSLSEEVMDYLGSGEAIGFHRRHNCRTRNPWHLVRNVFAPDAFLHYMSFSVPHVVLNDSISVCTNAIHRLNWRNEPSAEEEKAIAVASTTSLAQLSFEVQGRSYCGGLLKLEPTKALGVVLPRAPTSGIDSIFSEVSQLLRNGETELALELSDAFVLEDHLGSSSEFTKHLRNCWKALVNYRKRFGIRKASGKTRIQEGVTVDIWT